MWKKALCLIFAFLLSINSFAAVVSDNDGSAFITKAEFDSLKNNFQSQLDNYNSKIDSKIDNAIASYLAGIKSETVVELKNLYAMITDKKNVYWVSGQYSRTSGKPYPKLQFNLDQAFNTSAYKISASWPGDNLYLYEGTEKEGKYYVDYLMTLDATVTENESYIFADQGFSNTVPNNSYNPYSAPSMSQLSLINPATFGSYHYQPNGNYTDRNNYRGIFSAYFYDEDKTEGTNLMFTPWSTANTYAHISNNKDAIGNTSWASASFRYYPYNSSSTGYRPPTLTDFRVDTSKQTINPLSSSKRSDRSITIAKLDEGMYFPWLQKQWVMNEIYYNIVNNATGENLPIKYGVKLCETTEEGELEIKVKSDQAGIAIFHIGNPIYNYPKTANLQDETNRIYSTKNLAINEIGTIKFTCKKNEKVWFVYCGANDGAGCQVEFTSIIQTKKI